MNPASHVPLLFAAIGLAFLWAGGWRCLGTRRNLVQGRVWLTVGVIFGFVSIVLWWLQQANG